MKSGAFCALFMVAWDCTTCDDAGGCGQQRPVFPPSKSDFKPGDRNSCKSQIFLWAAKLHAALRTCGAGLAQSFKTLTSHPDAWTQQAPVFKTPV